ncbi:MAG: hypothetical protein HFE97_07720 [Oscillospiraceae bacterium]|nr:hypothetical protein [Oscillospiraceae bacterium]
MAEFEDRLNAILGDPEAMGQIVSIAKALTGGEGTQAEAPSAPPDPSQEGIPAPAPDPDAQPQPEQGPDWQAVMGLLNGLGGGNSSAGSPLSALGDLDPKLVQTAMRLFSEYSATDDRKIALLSALKPFLKPERYAKVDKAVQIAKLSRVIRVAFQLFKGDEGEAGHV